MATNYETILGRGFSELPEPTPLQEGKWVLKGRFAAAYEWESKETGDKGAQIKITSEAVKPADAETAALVNGSDDYKGKAVETNFYVTNMEEERKVWDHLSQRGIDVDGADSLEDALKQVRGSMVIATVRTRNFETKDGEAAFRNITVKTEAMSL